jgi:hypothetical protein
MLNFFKKIAKSSLSLLGLEIRRTGAIDITDDYITWLCFANAGMLTGGNLYCFAHAIKHLPSDKPVIEIGSFCGLSTNILNYYLSKEKKNNKIVTCDKWIFEGAEKGRYVGNSDILHSDYKTFVKETFKRNVNMFSRNNLPYHIEASSDDFFKLWSGKEEVGDIFGRQIRLGGEISFCYIDGNHTYDFAKRDFKNTDRYLARGGFILFDDSYDGSPFECARLMKEIVQSSDYDLVIKNPNYLFRKIK